jgi:hypothetical protein
VANFYTDLEEGVRVNPEHLRALRPDPVALWSRIERDHPSAMVALRAAGGKASQRPTDVGKRDWGDGKTNRQAHLIVDISLSERPQWAICRCGETVVSEPLSMMDAWDFHRGVEVPEPTAYHYDVTEDVDVHWSLMKILYEEYVPLVNLLDLEFRPPGWQRVGVHYG